MKPISKNKKESHNSFYHLLFPALIPTIIFAVSFVALLVYFYNSTMTEAKQNAANVLYQISDSCESKIDSLADVYAVLDNIPCISEATKKSDFVYTDSLSRTLDEISNSYSYLNCIYIYNPTANIVYHPQGQFSTDDFFSNTHSYSGYNTEYWSNFDFYHFEPYRILSPSALSSIDAHTTVIPVAFQVITETKQKNYLIFDVDMNALFETSLTAGNLTQNSKIYILNKYTNKVYCLSDTDFSEASFPESFIKKLLSSPKDTFSEDEMTVSLYSGNSSLVGYTYFATIPSSDIISMIIPNIIMSLLIVLLFFAISLIFTFRNTKNIYNPLKSIKKTLGGDNSKTDSNNILNDISTLAANIKKRFDKILPDAQEKYLINLLLLNNHFTDEIQEKEIRNSFAFSHNLFCVLIVQLSPTPNFFNSYTTAEFEQFKYGFYTVIKELFPQNFSLYVLPAEQDSFNIILNFDNKHHDEMIDELIKQIFEYLKNDAEFIKIAVGKSSICENLNELNNAYNDALKNLDEVEFSNARIILSESNNTAQSINFDKKTQNDLTQSLLIGNSDKVYAIINSAINEYKNSSPKLKKEIYGNILTIVLKIIRIKKIPYENNKAEYEIIHDCLNQPPKNAYRDMMILVDYLLKNTSSQKSDTIDYNEIISYINKNFSFQNLSLKFLADYFGVNASSLSASLKHKLSVGFHEYVTSLRIEKAKKLLTTTNKNIEDISIECGFSSSKTFFRVFKISVGVTPTEHRGNYTINA